MRQALKLICAFALGTAVSAAPAPRPGYYGEDPGTSEYPSSSYYYPSVSYEDPYPPVSYEDPYHTAGSVAYVAPTPISNPYPASDPYYYPPVSYEDPYRTTGYVAYGAPTPISNPYPASDPYYYPPVSSEDPYHTAGYVTYGAPTPISNPYPTSDPYGYPSVSYEDPSYPTPIAYTTPTYQDPGYVYPSQKPNSQYTSPPSYDPGYGYPVVSSSPAYPSIPTYPICLIEIITYVIEVEFYTEDIYLKEYRYLISTPADKYYPYAFGSIGKSIYKPDAHAAVFYVKSGSLDDDTASLAEFYKSYPHEYPPSDDEALYLWIYEYQIAVVYISRPPTYAAYTEFGVDIYGRLTYAGKSYWAVCPAPDCEDTWYVYWIGSGSAPYGCITDVYLRLVPYGFSSPKSYYYPKKGGNGGSYPISSKYGDGYYYSTKEYDPGYISMPTYKVADPYNPPKYTAPISYPYGKDPYTSSPYYPPKVTDAISYYPPSSYGYSDPYKYPQPTTSYDPSIVAYPTYTSDPLIPKYIPYPTYTSMVDGQPVTEYQTVTTYDNFDEEIMGRPTLM